MREAENELGGLCAGGGDCGAGGGGYCVSAAQEKEVQRVQCVPVCGELREDTEEEEIG